MSPRGQVSRPTELRVGQNHTPFFLSAYALTTTRDRKAHRSLFCPQLHSGALSSVMATLVNKCGHSTVGKGVGGGGALWLRLHKSLLST